MPKSSQRFSAVVVLGAYILAGVLLDVAHSHDFSLGLQSEPLLLSHDCGGKEIHVPVDQIHPCPACTYSSQWVAIPALPLHSRITPVHWTCIVPILCERPLTVDFLSTGKRGPPLES